MSRRTSSQGLYDKGEEDFWLMDGCPSIGSTWTDAYLLLAATLAVDYIML